MSWYRNLIGKAENVAASIEKDIAKEASALHRAVAAGEKAVVTEISKLFTDVKSELGIHVESQGHFNPDGTGQATVKIVSTSVPIATPNPAAGINAAEAPKEAGPA
jgi:hypothetical protein